MAETVPPGRRPLIAAGFPLLLCLIASFVLIRQRYSSASLTRNSAPLVPYSRALPRAIWWLRGAGRGKAGGRPIWLAERMRMAETVAPGRRPLIWNRLDLSPLQSPVFVPDVPPEAKPLFCHLQGLETTPSRTPTPQTPGPPYPIEPGFFRGKRNLTTKFDHQI